MNGWLRITSLSFLFTTDYGRLLLAKTALLVVLGGFGYLQRRRSVAALQVGDRRSLLRLAVWEVGVMAATIGVAVALGRTAPPPASPVVPSDIALVLGYDLPGPPTLYNLLTAWRFDLIFGTAAIVLAGLYLWGQLRLRRSGVDWPTGRAVSWYAGCFVLLFTTSSGLGRYAPAQFSLHMVQHMSLGMAVPVLLVLGAPTTLALRALPAARGDGVPGVREAIVGLTRTRVLRWLTHPLIIFALFIGSFFILYFTPLFDWMISSHVGHLVMSLHFLLVGYLYYWVIIGIDPAPRRLQPLIKLALLVGALPFHAFFGLALMNSRVVLGPGLVPVTGPAVGAVAAGRPASRWRHRLGRRGVAAGRRADRAARPVVARRRAGGSTLGPQGRSERGRRSGRVQRDAGQTGRAGPADG